MQGERCACAASGGMTCIGYCSNLHLQHYLIGAFCTHLGLSMLITGASKLVTCPDRESRLEAWAGCALVRPLMSAAWPCSSSSPLSTALVL